MIFKMYEIIKQKTINIEQVTVKFSLKLVKTKLKNKVIITK